MKKKQKTLEVALRETNETLIAVITVLDSENNAFLQSIAKRKARVFRIEMKNSSKNMPGMHCSRA